MELWFIYGIIAAILIATRDTFTKLFTSKYSMTEHLLYYYNSFWYFYIHLCNLQKILC